MAPRLSKSNIEYLDYVWNFESGCTKGCSYCYAERITKRFPDHYPDGFKPTLYPEAFTSPLRLKKPSIIGVGYMGDLFDNAIDPEQKIRIETPQRDWVGTAQLRPFVFDVIKQCPQHKFLFLTKQPQNLAKWSPFPENCWVGVSVTNLQMASEACQAFAQIDAKVKYVSFEPLLYKVPCKHLASLTDWFIIGAQTKPYIEPKIEWVRSIVEAADSAGIPVFLKNSLKQLIPEDDEPGWMVGWNNRPGELRHEMPE